MTVASGMAHGLLNTISAPHHVRTRYVPPTKALNRPSPIWALCTSPGSCPHSVPLSTYRYVWPWQAGGPSPFPAAHLEAGWLTCVAIHRSAKVRFHSIAPAPLKSRFSNGRYRVSACSVGVPKTVEDHGICFALLGEQGEANELFPAPSAPDASRVSERPCGWQ